MSMVKYTGIIPSPPKMTYPAPSFGYKKNLSREATLVRFGSRDRMPGVIGLFDDYLFWGITIHVLATN